MSCLEIAEGVQALTDLQVMKKEIETENNSKNTIMRWAKEVNKTVMRCLYQSDPTERGCRKQMMKIWREIGLFEITEQRLADQTRIIRTNGWFSEVELDKIKRKFKEGENMVEPNIKQQNIYDEERPHEEVNVEVMKIENMHSRLQDQGLTDDEIRLIDKVTEQMKIAEAPSNIRNFERKRLKSKLNEVN